MVDPESFQDYLQLAGEDSHVRKTALTSHIPAPPEHEAGA